MRRCAESDVPAPIETLRQLLTCPRHGGNGLPRGVVACNSRLARGTFVEAAFGDQEPCRPRRRTVAWAYCKAEVLVCVPRATNRSQIPSSSRWRRETCTVNGWLQSMRVRRARSLRCLDRFDVRENPPEPAAPIVQSEGLVGTWTGLMYSTDDRRGVAGSHRSGAGEVRAPFAETHFPDAERRQSLVPALPFNTRLTVPVTRSRASSTTFWATA